MIGKDEIQEKGREFGIHVADVQRDYVFGWILSALYSHTALRDVLILKGGNCFRKAYFPNARFSNDLDFSTESMPGGVTDSSDNGCSHAEVAAPAGQDLTFSRITLEQPLGG